ncbi:Xaa-Pro aminopeptidase [Elusimicrobium minutum Pei191]|uniref:Xaa-Pro aminopeptidase n=1 Tax=Elusimicrobium minutum (strain Pei191) TaxID=445932 RepID=B2KCP0_ELUMP|nr:aminopeptidase P family protein [Elusimicrobium minutum]ACC98286.1 Xaa-Pro aminopeptidase [Elusimicrobium minutum Pei191]
MVKTKFNPELIKKLQKAVVKNKLDAYFVTDYKDQLYLTGFKFYPQEAILLVTPKEVYCYTRDLYIIELGQKIPLLKASAPLDYALAAAEQAKKLKLKNVGFDAVKTYYNYGKTFEKFGYKPSAFTPGELREVKEKSELDTMRKANRIAYKTYEYIKKYIKTGMSEFEVAAEIERYMKSQGATALSFESTVCFGVNGTNTHHTPTKDKLKNEQAILLDFGCIYDNYCSDISRSWWHGKKPTAEYKKAWKAVDDARKAGIKAAKPGITGKELDLVPRNVIEKAGFGKYFIHRTGHGIGMQAHEDPNVEPQNNRKFVANNVITIEPGIYYTGHFGIRIEDTVVVTPKGGVILTKK